MSFLPARLSSHFKGSELPDFSNSDDRIEFAYEKYRVFDLMNCLKYFKHYANI